MLIHVDHTGSVAGLKQCITSLLQHPETKGLLIFACDDNGFTPASVNPVLQELPVPVFGGIFPELIYQQDKLTKGTIVAGLTVTPNVQVISGLSDMSVDYEAILDDKIPDLGRAKTMFVFVDGLSQRISALIDSLFNIFGLEVNYIGGGAGSLSFVQKPCLFTRQGLIQDSAVLALAELKSGVGVSHGWRTISGPFKVTEADRNIIKSLDWQPAFEVYRQVVEKASDQTFTGNNFFEIAKGFPFGINKLGAEKIVRDPIQVTPEGGLVCVGEVPPESFVDILSGNLNSLVDAASNALFLGQEAFGGDPTPQTNLFIDCISRVLFLEDDFSLELAAVASQNTPMIGALTLGEIANSGKDYLEFYNKTAVIGVLEG
ncbi:MAG: hypothetical protein Kow0031_29250 [Anaerolineae bacterium]